MKFDRMGRRVEYIETVRDDATDSVVTNKHQKFVYDGYLCIQRLYGANNVVTDLFEWDPTEPIATRPLYWQPRTTEGNYSLFYTHDGNKNVSEAVFYQRARGVAAHYEYAPFGEVTVQNRGNAWGSIDLSSINPWRFSSEHADDASATVYYNYRHYEPMIGRWMSMDPMEETGGVNLYASNLQINRFDKLGLKECAIMKFDIDQSGWRLKSYDFGKTDALNGFVMVDEISTEWEMTADVECCCWQWNWGWGNKSRRIKNTVTKSVRKEQYLPVEQRCVGYTPVGVTNIPNPISIIEVLGEISALALSKAISASAVLFNKEDAIMLAGLIMELKPMSLIEGEWPVEKCY